MERLYTEEVRAVFVTLALAGVTVATTNTQVPLPPAPPQEQTRPSFSDWLAELRAEALSRGLRDETVDKALATVDEPLPVVLERCLLYTSDAADEL